MSSPRARLGCAALPGAAAAALVAFSLGVWAAGPKSGGGGTVVVDDLPTGSAGSVGLSGGGATVDGTIGQTAAGAASGAGATEAESGFFSKGVGPAQTLSTNAVASSSATFTWADAVTANPSGTEYLIEVSSASNFTGTIFSSAAYSPVLAPQGLLGNTTYYGRIRAKYMEGDDSADTSLLDPILTRAFAPVNGAVAGTGARSARLAWSGGLNFGGSLSAWGAAAALPAARQAPAAAAFGRRVYVSGGVNGGAASEVTFATVQADGTLGSWTQTTALPAARHSHAMAAAQGVLYVVGGFDGSARSTVWYAAIQGDGSVGEWQTAASLPAARFRHALAVHEGRLYVSGGDNGVAAQKTVYYADVRADGSLGAWTTAAAELPAARSAHAMALSSGTLYVAGGVTTGVTDGVLKSELSAGVPGAWAAVTSLPAGRTQGALVAGDGRLFFLGGHDGSAPVASAYEAAVQADRTLGAWETSAALPAASLAHAAVRVAERVFLLGGFNDAVPLADVRTARLVGTEYSSERATDSGFTANLAGSGWTPGTEAELDGLTPNTTYFFRIRARNGAALQTDALQLGSTMTLAEVPSPALSTFSVVEVSSIGVQWSAGANPAGTEFRVQVSTAADFSGLLLEPAGWAAATSGLFNGLPVNTSHYFRVQARNARGLETAYHSLGARFTLSSAPVASAITATLTEGFTLQWSTGNLPFGTRYEAQASTLSSFSTLAASSVTLSSMTIFTGLPSAATFYARVRSINGNGVASAFDEVVSTRTTGDATPPSAAAGLESIPAATPGTLSFSWLVPGDDGGAGNLASGSAFFIQWSTRPFGSVVWSTGSAQVVIATGPVALGSRVGALLSGLPLETTASVVLWTRDESDNYSAPSAALEAFASPFSFIRLDGASGDVGLSPSMAFDRFGNLHVAYRGAGGDVRYLKRSGASWGAVQAPDPGVIAAEVRLAVDNDGNPQVAYRDAGVARIKVARYSGSWSASVVESGEFRLGGFTTGGNGVGIVTYQDVAAADLKIATWTGVAWSTSGVESAGNVGRLSALALDGFQRPHVLFADDGAVSLKIATFSPTNITTSLVEEGVNVASGPALALGPDGERYAAYVAGAQLKFSSAPAAVQVADDAASLGGIAVDGAGRGFIAYQGGLGARLKYARHTGVAWTTGTIDADGVLGRESSIAIDGGGSVAIAYYDSTRGDLKLAEWTGAVGGAMGGNAAGSAQAPSDMAGTALAGSVDRVMWTWTDNAGNELGFRLYGSTSPFGPFELVRGTSTLGPSAGAGATVSFTELGLAESTTYYRYAVALTSGGLVASKIASAYPYNAVDLSSPTVADNQAGDAFWRRSNTGVYNVDFADTGGAKLSKFQVSAATRPAGGSPALAGAGLTDVVTGINAAAYTSDWTLPGAFFTALWEGVTNYITVRVEDGNGNATTLADAFHVLKDTTAPTISDLQTGDDTPRRLAGTAYNVDALDGASGLAAFEYSASTAPGSADGGVIGWTAVAAVAGAPAYATDWTVDFDALPSEVTGYVSVRTWDVAGATTTKIDAFHVVKDTAGPTVAVSTPSAGFLSALARIEGTALDPRGVAGTELSIQQNPPTGLYWTGAAFSNAAPVFVPASGSSAWQLAAAFPWVSGSSYTVVARSTDALGNYSAAYSTVSFTFDASTPSAVVLSPVPNSAVSALSSLSGTAVDSGAGLALVEVAFRRLSDGKWWSWLADDWGATLVSTRATGTASWTVEPTAKLLANLASNTTYFVAARAVDSAVPANAGDFLALGSTFTFVDVSAPAAVTDLRASSGTTSGRIDLAWSAPGDDGSSGILLTGQYRVHYSTLSSVAFSTSAAQVVISTSSVSPGSFQSHALGGLVAGATYFLRLFTADDAGNWSSLSNGATMQAGPPLFNRIAGHVMKVSSEGITAVKVECWDASGVIVSSTFTVADGSGTFTLDNVPVGTFKVQASWTAEEITSSVWQDGIPMGAGNVDFVLNLTYTLATLTGTLQTLATPQGRRGAAAAAFLVSAQSNDFAGSKVELYAGGQRAVEVAVSPTGRWTIPNLLPGKYGVRAFNGISYTDVVEVEVGEGELKEVGFVYSPLPEPSVFAFPNPASGRTTIRFETPLLPLEAQVLIFDVAGQLVREIAGTEMTSTAPGVYHAGWDLRNSRGEAVASGVYLFMVKVRGGSENQTAKVTKKLAVVK